MIPCLMPLFTHYIAVDWSAANAPTMGKDSIWAAESGHAPSNIPTRFEAMQTLRARISQAIAHDERLLIGFDFAFGYPAGISQAICGDNHWRSLWAYLAQHVTNGPQNINNRFEVAGKMNRAIGLSEGPFWGHPWQHSYDNLGPKRPVDLPPSTAQHRIVETRTKGAKSIFQLAYNGAVGSQSILGMAALHGLISDPDIGSHIAVWPFETKLSGDFSKSVTLVEIYPSSHVVDTDAHDILDAAQVISVARDFANWDKTGALLDKLSAFGLSDMERDIVTRTEGWILGQ
ncbi:hypothetical protein [Fretibacter rubidus]|uniref:hypothetical protein n=1 Tax=Fretibacter rubidus TaxID=570162 RepID=UPI003529DD3A